MQSPESAPPKTKVISTFEDEMLDQAVVLDRMLSIYRGSPGPQDEIQRALKELQVASVLFLGMGSSLFAAYPAVHRLIAAGIPAGAIDAGEYLHYVVRNCQVPGCLVVLISQSGESPEVKQLAELLSVKNTPFVAITNNDTSFLARSAKVHLPLCAGAENWPSSKTHLNTIATTLCLANAIVNGSSADVVESMLDIPDHLATLLSDWRSRSDWAVESIASAPHIDVVGRGPLFSTACQGALTLRELALTRASPVAGGLLRHGLLRSLRGGALVAVAVQGPTFDITRRILDEAHAEGASVTLITDAIDQRVGSEYPVIEIPHVGESLAAFCALVPFQFLGIMLAESVGRVPGIGVPKVSQDE